MVATRRRSQGLATQQDTQARRQGHASVRPPLDGAGGARTAPDRPAIRRVPTRMSDQPNDLPGARTPGAEPGRAPSLSYRHGLAVVRHVREAPPGTTYDARAGAYVAPGHRLPELRAWAAEHGIAEHGAGPDRLDAPERCLAAGGRGSVVRPPGAGKSSVAILAVDRVAAGAWVIAPTRALVGQWFGQLADAFGADRVGAYYADEKDPRPITVTT